MCAWLRLFWNSEIFPSYMCSSPWVPWCQSSQWGHHNPSNLYLSTFWSLSVFCTIPAVFQASHLTLSVSPHGEYFTSGHKGCHNLWLLWGLAVPAQFPSVTCTEGTEDWAPPSLAPRFSTCLHLAICPHLAPAGSPRGRKEKTVYFPSQPIWVL